MKNFSIGAVVLAALLAAIWTTGCGGQNAKVYGKEIPADVELTSMSDVVEDAAAFDGKPVLLEGHITSECPSGCWFWLQDESGQLYVTSHASNFSIPQHVQKKARVYGRVFLEQGRPQVMALGVQLE